MLSPQTYGAHGSAEFGAEKFGWIRLWTRNIWTQTWTSRCSLCRDAAKHQAYEAHGRADLVPENLDCLDCRHEIYGIKLKHQGIL